MTDYLSTTECAERFGVSPDFWRTRAQRGDVRAIKLGKLWRLDIKDVQRYENERVWVPTSRRMKVRTGFERELYDRARREVGR